MKKFSPFKNFLKTSLPAAADLASQTLMWTIEAIFIGKISAASLAGHGLAIQVIVVFFAVLLTFIVGAGLIINHHLGAGEKYKANHIFGQAMMMGIIMAIAIALMWHFGAVHLFKIIKGGSSSAAQSAGEIYMRTVSYFAIFLVTNFVATGIVRAVGDTKYSMSVNLFINVLNVCLAPVLIFGLFGLPRLEVKGAALAVGISHTVGFLFTFYLLRSRRLSVILSFRELTRPKMSSFKNLFKKGIPTTIEQASWATGQLVVMGYVGAIGVTALTTHTIFMRIQNILSMVYLGFSLAAMSHMGRNLGAEDHDRAESSAHAAHWVMIMFVGILVILMLAFSKIFITVFTTDPATIELGRKVVYLFALAQIPKALNNVISGNLRGIGNLHWLMFNVMAFVLVFEIGLNYVSAFVLGWSLYGVWGIQTTDETIRFIMNYIKFIKGPWRGKPKHA